MEETYLRVAVLLAALAPMAIADLRERMVTQDTMCVAVTIGGCFFAHDILTGRFESWSTVVTYGMILSLMLGGLVLFMAQVLKKIGLPDAVMIFTIAMMLPSVSGIPVGTVIITLGYLLGLAFAISESLYKNIADALHKRPYAANFMMSHIKRRGEKFAIKIMMAKIGKVKDDVIYDDDGGRYFLKKKDSGMEVTTALPLVTLYCIAAVAVLAILFFTDINQSHLAGMFYEDLKIPEISIHLGFG